MATKNRTKEIWLIPKRVSVHQAVCLIEGILNRSYDGTTWNPNKQNDLGVNLKRRGATKDGSNISSQAIRTLAALPQYLGFLYIDTNKTPSTINITKAGHQFYNMHKNELKTVTNLVAGKDDIITTSKAVLQQMEKLQITNPIINKDCENIFVFPFRFMLKVLLEVDYLDQEEIAYFLFKVRNEDELNLIVHEIKNFRKLSISQRTSIIEAFKKTHIGNITLVQAASSGYYIALCEATGIIDRVKVCPENREASIPALRINEKSLGYVKSELAEKFANVKVYDFKDNLNLWIDYIGEPKRLTPPIDVSLHNQSDDDYLIQIHQGNKYITDCIINAHGAVEKPMFADEEYIIKVIDLTDGEYANDVSIKPTFSLRNFDVVTSKGLKFKKEESLQDIIGEIEEHCASQNFNNKTLNYLKALRKVTGIDRTQDMQLRGAYLEYYFYKLLSLLKRGHLIDDVVWNGKLDARYNLPKSAPGGKTGTPDIVFAIDGTHFILELTTIKAKALQFSAEGASVPDHVKIYNENNKNECIGIFSAPIIHPRTAASVKSTSNNNGVETKCIEVKELLKILQQKDKESIKNSIKNYSEEIA
ncbi:AlwI family type II restriction endonuclease [Candidatus Saccharibacteria bacterium]|nr:AlwI family type II restriction endonuclease [Candidatus Saccharibacteria bacterium]